MRSVKDWDRILQVEPGFLELEEAIRTGKVRDYRQIKTESFSYRGWDLIDEQRLFSLVLPFLRQQVRRAQMVMPAVYAELLAGIDPPAICTPEDWYRVPVLFKDDHAETGQRGFRDQAAKNPRILRPLDLEQPAAAFGSGGSLGRYTPTYVTLADRAREIRGWLRGHTYHGLAPGDRALFTYNTTHKGGQWMQESLWMHGVDVLSRRPEEDARRVLENLRDYGLNVLFTVQQPYEAVHLDAKSMGINLHALVMASLEDPDLRGILVPDVRGRRQVEFVFLGGFEIVPYALELAEEYLGDMPVATLLGSSEAIPQACSTNPTLTPEGGCHHNHLHLLHSPHYIEVVKRYEGAWYPVEKGEEGLLVYTSWARDGTIWLRYAPGDAATRILDPGECPCGLRSAVIGGVRRIDAGERDELLLTGCAAG